MPPNTSQSSRTTSPFQAGLSSRSRSGASKTRPHAYGVGFWLYFLGLLALLTALAVFTTPARAHAANPPDQTDKSDTVSSGFEGMPAFYLGTGLSGTVTSLVLNITNPGAEIVYDNLNPNAGGVWGYIGIGMNDGDPYAYYCPEDGVIPTGTNDVVWFPCPTSSPWTWDSADNQQIFQVSGPSGYGKPPWYVNGSSGAVAGYTPVSGGYAIGAPYVLWNQGGGPDWDGNPLTHVMAINAPEYLETVASTTVDVSVDVHLATTTESTNALFLIFRKDESGAYIALTELFENVGWNGTDQTFTLDTIATLPEEGTWNLTVRVGTCDEYGNCIAKGSGQLGTLFSVITPDDDWDQYIPGYVDPTGVPTDCDINFLGTFSFAGCVSYLLVPDIDDLKLYTTLSLEDRFPFSYAYQFEDIKDALYANENTAAQAITVPFGSFGNITFLSRDMVAAVPYASLIRSMLSAVMWFLLAYALYRMIIRSHDNVTV